MAQERTLEPEVLFPGASTLGEDDLRFLAEAARYLERPSFVVRLASLLGAPLERAVRFLPPRQARRLSRAVEGALHAALEVAISTLGPEPGGRTPAARRGRPAPARLRHDLASAVSGACGGLFGWAGLVVELPISTSILLRSIAAVAREHGEDLARPEARLECLAVFSHGSPAAGDDALDSSYLAIRGGLAEAVRQAAEFVARHGAGGIRTALARGSAPALVRLVAAIASRFQVVVSEKALAESIPVVGAAGGALVNLAFAEHFQRVARYHFGIRRLERRHGPEAVRQAYRDAARSLRTRPRAR